MPKFDFSRHPLPTPYERELLTILIEEAAEVIQRATKLLRFGATEIQPEQSFSNRERLSLELGDMAAVLTLLAERELVVENMVKYGSARKHQKLRDFMQHEPD